MVNIGGVYLIIHGETVTVHAVMVILKSYLKVCKFGRLMEQCMNDVFSTACVYTTELSTVLLWRCHLSIHPLTQINRKLSGGHSVH